MGFEITLQFDENTSALETQRALMDIRSRADPIKIHLRFKKESAASSWFAKNYQHETQHTLIVEDVSTNFASRAFMDKMEDGAVEVFRTPTAYVLIRLDTPELQHKARYTFILEDSAAKKLPDDDKLFHLDPRDMTVWLTVHDNLQKRTVESVIQNLRQPVQDVFYLQYNNERRHTEAIDFFHEHFEARPNTVIVVKDARPGFTSQAFIENANTTIDQFLTYDQRALEILKQTGLRHKISQFVLNFVFRETDPESLNSLVTWLREFNPPFKLFVALWHVPVLNRAHIRRLLLDVPPQIVFYFEYFRSQDTQSAKAMFQNYISEVVDLVSRDVTAKINLRYKTERKRPEEEEEEEEEEDWNDPREKACTELVAKWNKNVTKLAEAVRVDLTIKANASRARGAMFGDYLKHLGTSRAPMSRLSDELLELQSLQHRFEDLRDSRE